MKLKVWGIGDWGLRKMGNLVFSFSLFSFLGCRSSDFCCYLLLLLLLFVVVVVYC
jgi:hypothetical protein